MAVPGKRDATGPAELIATALTAPGAHKVALGVECVVCRPWSNLQRD